LPQEMPAPSRQDSPESDDDRYSNHNHKRVDDYRRPKSGCSKDVLKGRIEGFGNGPEPPPIPSTTNMFWDALADVGDSMGIASRGEVEETLNTLYESARKGFDTVVSQFADGDVMPGGFSGDFATAGRDTDQAWPEDNRRAKEKNRTTSKSKNKKTQENSPRSSSDDDQRSSPAKNSPRTSQPQDLMDMGFTTPRPKSSSVDVNLTEKIRVLEASKANAVTVEDFDEAKRIKLEIEALKNKLASRTEGGRAASKAQGSPSRRQRSSAVNSTKTDDLLTFDDTSKPAIGGCVPSTSKSSIGSNSGGKSNGAKSDDLLTFDDKPKPAPVPPLLPPPPASPCRTSRSTLVSAAPGDLLSMGDPAAGNANAATLQGGSFGAPMATFQWSAYSGSTPAGPAVGTHVPFSAAATSPNVAAPSPFAPPSGVPSTWNASFAASPAAFQGAGVTNANQANGFIPATWNNPGGSGVLTRGISFFDPLCDEKKVF